MTPLFYQTCKYGKMVNSTTSLTDKQITNGTASQKRIILKSFFKDDKCTIAPAKDTNGRYVGIRENISEVERLKLGYVPSIESSIKIYDGIEIDLNDATWRKDWEWMQHCREISVSFKDGQATPGAYFYIYRPGLESAEKVDKAKARLKLQNYIFNDDADTLYNRVKVMGYNMDSSTITDVQEYLLAAVETKPELVTKVYESDLFALELLLIHALENKTIVKRTSSYVFGDTFLGVDKSGVLAFLANPKNANIANTIEAVTYGRKVTSANPLEGEIVAADDLEEDMLPVPVDVEAKVAKARKAPVKKK